jgi:hypothetical protein
VTGPAGLTVTTNGLVQWKPAVSELGKSLVTVEVSDGVSTTQAIFPITVATEIAPRLEIVSTRSNSTVLRFRGLPDFKYQLQQSGSVKGVWTSDENTGTILTKGFENAVEKTVEHSNLETGFFRLIISGQ